MNLHIRIFQHRIKPHKIQIVVDNIGAVEIEDAYAYKDGATLWPAVSFIGCFNLKTRRFQFAYGLPYPRENGAQYIPCDAKHWGSHGPEYVEKDATCWEPVHVTIALLQTLRKKIENSHPGHWSYLDYLVSKKIIREHCYMVFDALEAAMDVDETAQRTDI